MSFTEQAETPTADLTPGPDFNALGLVPYQVAASHLCLPFALHREELSVAFAGPADAMLLENLRLITGKQVKVFRGNKDEIRQLLKTHQPLFRGAVTEADSSRAVHLLNHVLRVAVRRRASDIHLEPLEGGCLQLRLRVDGHLRQLPQVEAELGKMLIGRIKVLASMDVAEHRLPQDGRFTTSVEGRDYDVRAALIPVIFGEKIVLRLLSQEMEVPDLASLGLRREDDQTLRQFLQRGRGMMIVVGPTGSGKTTTLYGCLRELLPAAKNLTSVEDPVEYAVSGVNQMAVRPAAGLTFATALRAVVRQDPDVLMIGEIRDVETAHLAVRAALTGHLVLTSLHAETTAGGVMRLLEMGVEPYLVHAAVGLVVNQRLIRLLCPICQAKAAAGCAACGGAGFAGRTGSFEVAVHHHTAVAPITSPEDLLRLLPVPRSSLGEDAAAKLAAGRTSMVEIAQFVAAEKRS